MQGKIQIISGSAHPDIAEDIARHLQLKLCTVSLGSFSNGETSARIEESVRGDDVFIIQSHTGSVNDAIMEQAILIDAAKRASAGSITAVCPFMAYARQDRKSGGREPITARLVVDILASAGADRIMSIDLHTGQIQGFMDGPFDHLVARALFADALKEKFRSKDIVIISPDAGRVKTAERYSNMLGCGMAIVHKHRNVHIKNSVEARHLIGDVSAKVCIIVDDMIDTAGTICAAAELVARHGAKSIYGVATHGLFSGPALERIEKSKFDKIFVTDTLPQDTSSKKLEIIPVSYVLAKAIEAIHTGGSVSSLFAGDNQF